MAIQESHVTIWTYCGPCGHPRVPVTIYTLCGLCGHSIYDNHMGCNMYIGREQIPVWPYEPHCVTTRFHGYYTIAFGRPMWPSSCGPLSWECGHTGHNKYRYFHETLRWPHVLQWALIFAWSSWITTRAATGIWYCTSLLLGHMGHSCYKLTWKCDDHMGWIVYRGRPLYGHMGRYMYDG